MSEIMTLHGLTYQIVVHVIIDEFIPFSFFEQQNLMNNDIFDVLLTV